MKNAYISTIMLLSALCFRFQAQAQAVCGFDAAMANQLKTHPQYAKSITKADSIWAAYQEILNHTGRRLTIQGGDTIYEIPTVIHVLTTGGAIGTPYNPPDSILEKWIDYLNKVYAGIYPGYPQAGNGGVSLPVKFVLAQRAPDCNPTNGIERINLSQNITYVNYGLQNNTNNGLTTEQVSAYQWPRKAYYNMYVINKIDGEDGNCTGCSYVAGFAYLGLSSNINTDGAYMLAKTAHAGNITLPHEIGHALGLYHVFEGGSATACPPTTNCNTDNDKVCDTDPSRILLGTCPSATANNPCTNLQYGANGVQHNFMNYSQCQNHFTQGQADRMMLMLQTYRSNLIASNGALPPPATSITSVATACQPDSMSHVALNSNVGPCNVFLDSIQYYSNGYLPYYNTDDSFYYDHTVQCALATHTSLIAGDTYNLSVSTQLNGQYVKVYIDYNNDGTFTPATETVLSANSNVGDTTYTVAIVPPTTAVTYTPLRMRVIADYGNLFITPCGNLNYGQAEDFSVTILPNSPLNLGPTKFSGLVISPNQGRLQWEINGSMEEINAFELQRSNNGRDFHSIAFINRKNNSSNYEYNDYVSALNPVYYYRLKLISNQDKTTFSKVVALNFERSQQQQIKIFPNPVENQLTVVAQNPLMKISVYDALGRIVIQKVLSDSGEKELNIDFSNLPAGIYLIRALDNTDFHVERKLIKK